MRLRLSLEWTALAELLEPLQLPEGKYGKPNMGEYQLCSLRRRLLVPCARSSLLRLSLEWTALAELLEPLQLPEGKYGKPNMGEYQLCSLRRRLLVPCARSSLLRLSGQPSPSASRRLCGSPEAYWSACGQSENKLPWASFCSRPCNRSSIVESRAQIAVGVLRGRYTMAQTGCS